MLDFMFNGLEQVSSGRTHYRALLFSDQGASSK